MEKVNAYVFIVVTVGREKKVLEEIKKINGISEAMIVYGEYDIVARVTTSSLKELTQTVMKIRRINDVLRSETLIFAI